MTRVIVDTGPLVAFFSRDDRHHQWVTQAWRISAEFVTCEAVIAEAQHLLERRRGATDALLEFVEAGGLAVRSMAGEMSPIRSLCRRYASVPMSFADACLVRMSELEPRALVCTCDSDFQLYRRLGRQVLPLLAPFSP